MGHRHPLACLPRCARLRRWCGLQAPSGGSPVGQAAVVEHTKALHPLQLQLQLHLLEVVSKLHHPPLQL